VTGELVQLLYGALVRSSARIYGARQITKTPNGRSPAGRSDSVRYHLTCISNPADQVNVPQLTLLHDEAVFQRTPAGQRELTNAHPRVSPLEARFLSAVTGHTPLRVLLDLGLDKPGIGVAIVSLAEHGLIRLVPTE
jgi:hypothetical protein